MGAYGRIIENARGAQQPHARLRWRVPWGAANGRAKVPSILGASEIREHERACIGSKATVHPNPPFGLCRKGETPSARVSVGDLLGDENFTSALHSRARECAGTSSLDECMSVQIRLI